MKKTQKNKKVYVGLSGGVDSSVSALLLKKDGYDVTGVFIKVWYPDFLNCNWKEEMRDAMRICAQLDIPFKMLDLSKEYKQGVIDYMISEYKSGRTPNPDVMCNKEVKFGGFYDWAINKEGADFVATGHYAQIKEEKGKYFLLKGLDSNKDQTYFLWSIKTEQLPNILFPIGNLQKEKVRKIAQKNNLLTATKADSQGLCFLGKLSIKDFLQNYINNKEGDVLNENGEKIGTHPGSFFFTLGQRHGFSINNDSNHMESHYVIDKNLEQNTIVVSKNKPDNKYLNKNQISISHINLISSDSNKKKISAVFRYRQKPIKISLNVLSKTVVLLEDGEISPEGQSVVFYSNNECLGGAIIEF